ncbi:MAG: ribonuclease E activity regulator RraA [Methylococcales bacterium]
MSVKTADLCDTYSERQHVQIAEPIFKIYGAVPTFSGRITTLRVFEDNTLVRTALEKRGENRVLVIDGGGSHRCALVGDNLAKLAVDHGWSGLVVYGCIRDSAEIDTLPIGIRALHTHPLKSRRRGAGEQDILVTFAGVNFKTDHYIYVDQDGIIVAEEALT